MRHVRILLVGMTAVVALLVATPTSHADPPPPPEWSEPDGLVPPPEDPGEGGAPSSTQSSEFMAGNIVYSVVFVESSGGAGNCSPAIRTPAGPNTTQANAPMFSSTTGRRV
jgi:hypothetical protein